MCKDDIATSDSNMQQKKSKVEIRVLVNRSVYVVGIRRSATKAEIL